MLQSHGSCSLPLELRIVGALIRLYGLPLIRIVHLTTERAVDETLLLHRGPTAQGDCRPSFLRRPSF
ncbi:hypothetical protein M2271_007856 [Streptomyces sp. LBL]|nr:hypothetical protein [Streptomyces sp. LBL]